MCWPRWCTQTSSHRLLVQVSPVGIDIRVSVEPSKLLPVGGKQARITDQGDIASCGVVWRHVLCGVCSFCFLLFIFLFGSVSARYAPLPPREEWHMLSSGHACAFAEEHRPNPHEHHHPSLNQAVLAGCIYHSRVPNKYTNNHTHSWFAVAYKSLPPPPPLHPKQIPSTNKLSPQVITSARTRLPHTTIPTSHTPAAHLQIHLAIASTRRTRRVELWRRCPHRILAWH